MSVFFRLGLIISLFPFSLQTALVPDLQSSHQQVTAGSVFSVDTQGVMSVTTPGVEWSQAYQDFVDASEEALRNRYGWISVVRNGQTERLLPLALNIVFDDETSCSQVTEYPTDRLDVPVVYEVLHPDGSVLFPVIIWSRSTLASSLSSLAFNVPRNRLIEFSDAFAINALQAIVAIERFNADRRGVLSPEAQSYGLQLYKNYAELVHQNRNASVRQERIRHLRRVPVSMVQPSPTITIAGLSNSLTSSNVGFVGLSDVGTVQCAGSRGDHVAVEYQGRSDDLVSDTDSVVEVSQPKSKKTDGSSKRGSRGGRKK